MAHKFRRDIVLEKIKICLKALPFVIPVRMMMKAHLLYLNKEEKEYEGWEKRPQKESSWYCKGPSKNYVILLGGGGEVTKRLHKITSG